MLQKLANKQQGFTLTEVLIVVAIVAILAGIAIPSYQDSVRKAMRADAKESLLSAAAMQEKHYLQYYQYSDEIDDVGGSASAEGYYTISLTGGATFLLTATATGAQTSDTDCAVFTLNHVGLQKAYTSGNAENPACW